jgi:hypothetical protein
MPCGRYRSVYFDFGDQVAHRRIPTRKIDTGCLADGAASPVASDEVLGPKELAARQHDVDAGAILSETRCFASAIDRHRQLADPVGQYPLDVVLPQRQAVRMSGGKVADVQTNLGIPRHLRHLPLR